RETYAVRAVRVGKVAGGIYLVRLYLFKQIYNEANVFFAQRLFLDQACLVEGHIQEVNLGVRDADIPASRLRLSPPDQAFNRQHFGAVDLSRVFIVEVVYDLPV